MAFRAAFDSPCAEGCLNGIKTLDLIRRHPRSDPPVFSHIECPSEPGPDPVCPGCRMVLPKTGVCDDCG